jgi:putative drug exporter of the RND superfamily
VDVPLSGRRAAHLRSEAGSPRLVLPTSGTDYALLLTARYREELRRHADRHQAMALALHRAAPAIIASGATVILSLLTLLVAELCSTKSLGPVMAIGIAVGLLAMITLLPALLVIFGRWVFGRGGPRWGRPSRPSTACGRGSGSAWRAGRAWCGR